MNARFAPPLLTLALLAADPGPAPASETYEEAPILYSATTPTNAISRLEEEIKAGRLSLGEDGRTMVASLLQHLNIPASSQLLVFSKTSLQHSRIDPRHPRAIYFSDECYVGWCPGGLVEITVMDPHLGPVFYALDPRAKPSPSEPVFVRDQNCLSCHGGHFVRGIPSVFARSIPTDETGRPLLRLGSEVIDYRTPFQDRWGGWYVTGHHGEARHRGNLFSRDEDGQLVADVERGANLTDLSPFFDPAPYLASTSDLVALMVFEHQIAMHNALTRAAFDARRMLRYQQTLQEELGEPVTAGPVYPSVKRVFENRCRELVDHLLFFEEAELPRGGIRGDGKFQETFAAGGRRDGRGHSLKDLNLESRLFENRCSYLIDAPGFAALPAPLKSMVYERLARALHPTDSDDRYYYIRPSERARIVGILRETHAGLPPDWLRN